MKNRKEDKKEEVQDEELELGHTQSSSSHLMTIVVTTAPIIELGSTEEGTIGSSLGRGLAVTMMMSLGKDVSLMGTTPTWISRALYTLQRRYV